MVMVWSWYGHGMVMVWSWYGHGMVMVWSWYGHGMVMVWSCGEKVGYMCGAKDSSNVATGKEEEG